ncbi:MAG TPA: hypothetical protein VJW20_06640 [Candidatus Angelobacter sp.]|nr:hypothetical protein [Candidatus Angelobacter sp.]
MPGKTVSKTEYGKLSLACTALFILFTLIYLYETHSSSKPPLIPDVWYYSFCLLGFLTAIVLAIVAGFRESRWWWLAILPAGGCGYVVMLVLVFAIAFRNVTPWH